MAANVRQKKVKIAFALVLVFFASFIFIPAIFILKSASLSAAILNPLTLRAIGLSFLIGVIVTVIDLIIGVPLAWFLVRSKRRFARWLDNLIDLSLVMPTAALGFSIYIFWGSSFGLSRMFGLDGGLIAKGPLLIMLLHIVFTLPYMVRSVSAAMLQINATYEEAAASLGASPFSSFRTVALPLFRGGVINGAVLAFTRSLSETGATMMVAGALTTAPVLIIGLKEQGNLPAAGGVSVILILAAVLILFLARLKFGEKTISLGRIYPKFEFKLSQLGWLRNLVVILFYISCVFLPTIALVLYYFGNFNLPPLGALPQSLIISFGVALTVTMINLIFAIPFAYIIARNRFRLGKLLNSLNEAVLLMPTSALGLSLALFWRQFSGSDILVLCLAHLCLSFPYLVTPIASALKEISVEQQEAARSLGARTRQMFFTILLPQIKPAIIAGAIMAFMRSLSETGATLAVTGKIKTVSILIVDLFKADRLNEAAFASLILFVIAFIFLFLLKRNQKVHH
jgi:thiamine transport system permease protein